MSRNQCGAMLSAMAIVLLVTILIVLVMDLGDSHRRAVSNLTSRYLAQQERLLEVEGRLELVETKVGVRRGLVSEDELVGVWEMNWEKNMPVRVRLGRDGSYGSYFTQDYSPSSPEFRGRWNWVTDLQRLVVHEKECTTLEWQRDTVWSVKVSGRKGQNLVGVLSGDLVTGSRQVELRRVR